MPELPLLSIVTITHNDLPGLQRTAASLPRPLPEGVEWHVVGGGEESALRRMLEADGRCTWVSDANAGVYDAMNRGTDETAGRWLLYLNGGDALHGIHGLDKLVEVLRQTDDSQPLLIGGVANYVLANSRRIKRSPKPAWYINHGMPTLHQAIVYPRSLLPTPTYPRHYRVAGDYHTTAYVFSQRPTYRRLHDFEIDFYVGGTSFVNPRLLVMEAFQVQRSVLGLPWVVCVTSLVFREINMLKLRVRQRAATRVDANDLDPRRP